jgi:hypothetical protein
VEVLITVIILGSFALILAIVFAFMWLLFSVFYQASGWKALAQRFPASLEPSNIIKRQTIKVGVVRWRSSATVGVSRDGLYLAVSPTLALLSLLIRHTPLLIPWSEISVIGRGRIYQFQKATELSIGNPRITTLTVFQQLFETVTPYISGQKEAGLTSNNGICVTKRL